MNTRRFGRAGIDVSEIAFGGGRTGGILIDADDDTRRRAIRTALDHGINWFDTAPQYGDGKSEKALGWLLAEIDETPYVSTKVRIGDADLGDIAGKIERSLHESLARLQRGSVDLLQLHNLIETEPSKTALTVDHVLGPNGVAEEMERLRDQGLIRFMGMSALGDHMETARIIESGRFDSAQVYYNMINPSAARAAMPDKWSDFDSTGIIEACKQQDMAVMAIRIFAASYLATPIRTGRESYLTRNTDAASEARMSGTLFAVLGDQYGTRAQTATRFALSNLDVSFAVIGLSDPAHIDEAVAAAEKGKLPAEAFHKLEALYESGFAL